MKYLSYVKCFTTTTIIFFPHFLSLMLFWIFYYIPISAFRLKINIVRDTVILRYMVKSHCELQETDVIIVFFNSELKQYYIM